MLYILARKLDFRHPIFPPVCIIVGWYTPRMILSRWYNMYLVGCIYPLVNVYVPMEKLPLLMGKSTISMAIFNSYVCLPEGTKSSR